MRPVPAIPPLPGTIQAPGYTPAALAGRATFLRDAAAAWAKAGHAATADSLSRAADVQAERHGSRRP